MKFVNYDYDIKTGNAIALFVESNGQSLKLILTGRTVKTDGGRNKTGYKNYGSRKDAASAYHTYLNLMKTRCTNC